MWQGRKLRQLTELEELEKTGTQGIEPEPQITRTHCLLSLDLPGATTVSPLAVTSGYFPIFQKTKPKLLFSQNLNLDIVHSLPL